MLRRALTLLMFLTPASAWAQRGLPQASRYADTPLSGFPGLLDTFAPRKGDFVFNLGLLGGVVPTAPIDYGITDTLSIGTNGLAGLALLAGVPAGMVKVRLNSSPTDWLSFATTGYGLYAKGSTGSDDSGEKTPDSIKAMGYMATFNSSLFFTRTTWLTATLVYASAGFEVGTPSDDEYEKTDMSLLFGAVTFQHFFKEWFGLRGSAGTPLLVTLASDGGTGAAAMGLSLDNATALAFAGVGADFRLGQRWLLAPTVLALVGDSKPVPSISLEGSFRW